MHQPPGFKDPQHPNYVCYLQRSLYGLKQAPRAWYQRFVQHAIRMGFCQSPTDLSFLRITTSQTPAISCYTSMTSSLPLPRRRSFSRSVRTIQQVITQEFI